MEKNLGLISGVGLVMVGLIARNKATSDDVNVSIKKDIGDKTMANILIVVGVALLVREVTKK